MRYRHPKTNRAIWNHPLCTDDFGNLVYRCHYTSKLVDTSDCIFIGACIPQGTGTYVCARDADAAFRKVKRAFDEIDANCNACAKFKRLPHDKNKAGFVKGACTLIPTQMLYNHTIEFWIHPDDCMLMPCWTQRPQKVDKK